MVVHRWKLFPARPATACQDGSVTELRFLTLTDVAEVLNVSAAQAYALVRSGDLPAVKIGGRGQWRVEHSVLEVYIRRLYDETAVFIAQHPHSRVDLSEAAH